MEHPRERSGDLAMSAYGDLILTHDDLVGYWRLDEASGSAADAFGANDGNNTDITSGAAGALAVDADTADSFNGATSQSNVGIPAAFQWTTGSVEAWFKVSGATAQKCIVGKSGA